MSLTKLLEFFPSGTAEGETGILDQVFVYAQELGRILAPPEGNPHLLVGDKGSGKTALIDFSNRLAEKQGIPSIVLRPYDFDTSSISQASIGDMQRNFHDMLMAAMAGKLSENDTGWNNAEQATLYREAVNAGVRSQDLAGRFGKILSEIAKPIIQVDMAAAFPHLTVHTRQDVQRSLTTIVGRKSFYLFIDDTDQIGSPEEAGHLNRVWALLLAVRRLSMAVPALKAIVTLRSEVWNRMQRDQKGQRDQTDHFKSLVVRMNSSREHVERILDRRLALASAAVGGTSDGYAPFFEGLGAVAFGNDFRSWKDLITVRSRERPRDAIQLVNALAQQAGRAHKTLIDADCFLLVMPAFSQDVSQRFAEEVVFECPQALEILKTFANAEYDHPGFTLSSDQALKHFKKVFSKFAVQLYGRPLGTDVERDSFDLWRFFYTCGVLNGRVSDRNQKDGYRHLDPENDLMLVSKARWNDLQQLLWEVNAAYRDYLFMLRKEEEQRLGLPTKKPRRGRRY